MALKDCVEYLYLALMLRWEDTAPLDGHLGIVDGVPTRNTQIARLKFLLDRIAAGNEEHFYTRLAQFTRRRDGNSYISKNASWMEQPSRLACGWFFEGCTSLIQKQEITQQLTKLGLSPAFVACVDDFVAGRTVRPHHPTGEEMERMVAKAQADESADAVL